MNNNPLISSKELDRIFDEGEKDIIEYLDLSTAHRPGEPKTMIKAVKQKGIIGKTGKLEIQTEDIPEGTEVEIIILVSLSETDTTEYLLSTEANQEKLLEAIERVENKENMIVIRPEEWHEKYSF